MAARRVEGVQIERAADEILALKEGSLEAHALNQSAAVVYELCDGSTSKSEMAAEIHRRTGLPADEEIVDLALSELVETGLVMLDDPEFRSAVTRRALVRRNGRLQPRERSGLGRDAALAEGAARLVRARESARVRPRGRRRILERECLREGPPRAQPRR